MIKTKMIQEGALSCDASLDYKINKFIQEMEQGIKTGKVDNTIADEILLIRLLYEG